MIKNFHFKMLFGASIFAFIMSFVFLFSALKGNNDPTNGSIGILFSTVGFCVGITAGGIRSINQRLDQLDLKKSELFPKKT